MFALFVRLKILILSFLKKQMGLEKEKLNFDLQGYMKSDYNNLSKLEFQQELKKLITGQESIIDFDEQFYLMVHKDVDEAVKKGHFSSGYIHYCLCGKNEERLWSNRRLKKDFSISPHYALDYFPAVNMTMPPPNCKLIPPLPQSKKPLLLIFVMFLQDDLFFGGYSALFNDLVHVFSQFDKVIVSVECEIFNSNLATRYAKQIEVIHEKRLSQMTENPDLIVCYNHFLFHKAVQLFNNVNKTIYYCQEFEACDFLLGERYIAVEKAIVQAKNIVISTEILKDFFVKRKLITDNNVFVTSPKIEVLTVLPKKTKRLFFYFRPEEHNRRNLSALILSVVNEFSAKHSGYTIYMVGTVSTQYSYEINGTPIYVLSKLEKQDYCDLLSSCDLVVSLIYSAHPGIIAFQAAASGIPAITNTFENRDRELLRKISSNLVPYDPVRDNLLTVIENALTLSKGNQSFDSLFYSGHQDRSLFDFVEDIWAVNSFEREEQ